MIELVTTSGVFRLDGGSWEVINNIWLVGDDREVIVIDAAHDARPIVEAVGGRRVTSIALTHGHNDHINAAVALRDAVDAPILLHPTDRMLWNFEHPDYEPDRDLVDGGCLTAGGAELWVRPTPGHSPGGCCLVLSEGGHVFSGDTLFCGGPGATGRSYSDSDHHRFPFGCGFCPSPETVVHTGHGETTTIGREAPDLEEWVRRGH